jgi:hypothetical protein
MLQYIPFSGAKILTEEKTVIVVAKPWIITEAEGLLVEEIL